MAGRFSVEAVFKAVDKITAPVKRIQNRVGKMTRSMVRGMRKVNRVVNKTTASIKRSAMATAAALAIVSGALLNVVGAGAQFEQAITNVAAVGLKTRAEIKPLEDLAKQLGRTTKFTATEAAGAMEILARSGFKTNEILSATPGVLAAAAASGMEIVEVADHVSNVLKGMGLEASQAAMVADVLALASSKTNSTIGSLGESLRNVSSTARQLKIPLKDAVASVALLQDVGLDASVAGSAFNTMLTKMAAPTAGMQKKMRKLGISFKDAKGNMRPFADVIGQLNKASKRVGGNFDKVAFLAELVGLRGQKAAANLADLFEKGKLQELTKVLGDAEGSAEKMANIRMDTTLGSWLLFKSAVDAVKVSIFDMNQGPLKETIDKMTAWVSANEKLIASKVGKWINDFIKNLPTIIKWVKIVLKMVAVLYALVTVLKILSLVLTTVNLIMAANPIVLITLGIMALIAATVIVIKWWKKFGTTTKLILAGLMLLMGPIGWLILASTLIINNWKPIKNFFIDLFKTIGSHFKWLIDKIMWGIDKVRGVADFFGFGGDDDTEQNNGGGIFTPQTVGPQDRAMGTFDEKRTVQTAEVTIKDETGRAELTGGKLGGGLSLAKSGVF